MNYITINLFTKDDLIVPDTVRDEKCTPLRSTEENKFRWKHFLVFCFSFYDCRGLVLYILQFFLSMYGHKLPVLCLDISSDSSLLVTGSADRNVKIWGMDFGDCHKSIFAHDDR